MRKVKQKRRVRWGALIGLLAGFLVIVFGIVGLFFYLNPFFGLRDEMHLEAGEAQIVDYMKSPFVDASEVKITGDFDPRTVGEYDITVTYNGKEKKIHCIVEDTKPPRLSMRNYTTDMIEDVRPESFIESCDDGNGVTFAFKEDPGKNEGKTKVTIIATDAYEHSTEAQATLIRKQDTEAPKINSVETLTGYVGGYVDTSKGVEVEDDLDTSPIIRITFKNRDFNTAGEHDVTITVVDRSGNSTETEGKVVLEDITEETKVMYLTFDDGPSENTATVLDTLDRYNAKATFFVTGNGQEYNDYIVQAYNAGHTIGLHTYTHDYAQVYASMDAYYKDLKAISDMVEELTGEKSYVIRFPGGSSNSISANYSSGIMSKLVDDVQAKGYQYFDWNVSSGDASENTAPRDFIVANSCAGTDYNQIVLLMHDSSPKTTTAEALPQIIEFYREQGYIFLPLTVDSYAAHHGTTN